MLHDRPSSPVGPTGVTQAKFFEQEGTDADSPSSGEEAMQPDSLRRTKTAPACTGATGGGPAGDRTTSTASTEADSSLAPSEDDGGALPSLSRLATPDPFESPAARVLLGRLGAVAGDGACALRRCMRSSSQTETVPEEGEGDPRGESEPEGEVGHLATEDPFEAPAQLGGGAVLLGIGGCAQDARGPETSAPAAPLSRSASLPVPPRDAEQEAPHEGQHAEEEEVWKLKTYDPFEDPAELPIGPLLRVSGADREIPEQLLAAATADDSRPIRPQDRQPSFELQPDICRLKTLDPFEDDEYPEDILVPFRRPPSRVATQRGSSFASETVVEEPEEEEEEEESDGGAGEPDTQPGACRVKTRDPFEEDAEAWQPEDRAAGGGAAHQEAPAAGAARLAAGPAPGEAAQGAEEKVGTQKTAGANSGGASSALHRRTTVMLRNLPNNYTRDALLQLIDREGFAGRYDFFYLPMDFRTRAALGYAFINMVTPEDADKMHRHLSGFSRWSLPSNKVCIVGWSHPHQGLQPHVQRYRNSPLMHEAVPDSFRPALFKDGVRIPFPPASKKIKPPRQGTQRVLL